MSRRYRYEQRNRAQRTAAQRQRRYALGEVLPPAECACGTMLRGKASKERGTCSRCNQREVQKKYRENLKKGVDE